MGDDGGDSDGFAEADGLAGPDGLAGADWRRSPRLAEAVAGGLWLTAACGCGARGGIDPADWLREGLGRLRLTALEDRLRCGCGARRARLSGCRAPMNDGDLGPIHVFR